MRLNESYNLWHKEFVLLLLSSLVFAGCSNSQPQLKETEQRGNKIIQALKRYRTDTGDYPKTLVELSPKYLQEIPLPTWGLKEWIYEADANSFNLQVNETIYTGDGNSHWFRYLGEMHGWQTGD
jgi:type II secretory pathway pseudopilin PulG